MKRALALSALLLVFALGVSMKAQTAYAQPQAFHGVLSANDQSDFDKDYAKWIDATRRGDQEDISENASKMQAIMARYNIASGVPFDQVASTGAPLAGPNQAYPGAYAQRLSPDDQKEFDKQYGKWVELSARHKKHTDDIEKNEHKMQDIMARYNIPANVPYDAIASPGASYR